MPALPYLDADTVVERLPWPLVIDVLESAAAEAFASDRFVDRSSVQTPAGELLLMPAVSDRSVGIKLVGVGLDNAARGLPRISALYVLFDAASMAPVALLDGTALTAIRTAAQSAMVLRRIAPPEARSLVVFGTGPQARAHVQSVCSVRRIESIKLVGRRPAAVDALCRELEREGVSVAAGRADDVAGADIVVCATSSATPVFDGGRLGEQVAVVAVGSHTPEARELDDTTFRRARVVIVEHRATALREAGDVIQALAARALDLDRVLDLGQLTDPELSPAPGISVYKSVGLAYQDLAVATAALDRPVH